MLWLLLWSFFSCAPTIAGDTWFICTSADGSVKIDSDPTEPSLAGYKTLSRQVLSRELEDYCVLKKSRKRVLSSYQEISLRRVQFKVLNEIQRAWVICEARIDKKIKGDSCREEPSLDK